MQNYKGKILISTPDSNVDIFSKSVVLIVEHNDEGAFGLILNKKGKHFQSNFQEIIGTDMDIFLGGPVEKEKLFFIVKGETFNEFHLKIDDHFFVTEDIAGVIQQINRGKITPNNVKVLIGYSGWSKGQLEGEIERGSWLKTERFPFNYTDKRKNLWKMSMENLGGENLLWANAPEDISLN